MLRNRNVYLGSVMSRILIFLSIQDPAFNNIYKRGRGQTISCLAFFVATNIYEIEHFIFGQVQKKYELTNKEL
jgi:hypothetical protein